MKTVRVTLPQGPGGYYVIDWIRLREGKSAEQIAEELRKEHHLEAGDEACFCSGEGDWKNCPSQRIQEIHAMIYADEIRILVEAIRLVGATPILFCISRVYNEGKIEMARLLKIEYRCCWNPERGWLNGEGQTYGAPMLNGLG